NGRMKIDTDTLGVYRQSSFLIDIGETAVRFQMQMGLAAGVSVDLCHVRRAFHDGSRLLPFDTVGLIIYIRRTGMDLDGILRNGFHSAHVSRQEIGRASCRQTVPIRTIVRTV